MNKRTILLCGADGYIGTPLTLRLVNNGYNVIGIDNFIRRKNVEKMNSMSVMPIMDMEMKTKLINTHFGSFHFYNIDISKDFEYLKTIIKKHQPDTIVNLAQQPSAPFSHKSYKDTIETITNNELGIINILYALKDTNVNIPLVTVGSMGEYDQSMGVDIEEGIFNFHHNGKNAENTIFPRRAFSFYHGSKIASTYYIDLASRSFGIRATDIMQGIVYGNYTKEIEETGINTRLDSDECFIEGTEIYTPNGIKYIENMSVGDIVYTHNGYGRKITQKMVNDYNGNIYDIDINNKISFSCTPNHPFLISIRNKTNLSDPKWLSAEDIFNISRERKYTQYNNEYEKAIELRRKGLTYKDISEKLNIKYTTITSWLGKGQKPRTIKRIDETFNNDIFFMIPILEEGNEEIQIDIQQYLSYGVVKDGYIYTTNPINNTKIWGEKHKISNILDVDEDFCLLSGYYIAEGSKGNFSFHKDEIEYHNDVIRIMKNKFNKDIRIDENGKSDGISLCYGSKIVSDLFSTLFGSNAHNKEIPETFLSLPNSKIKELIKGYWRGDGYYSSNGCRYNVGMSSVSEKLINQIKILLMRFGILSSIHKRKRTQLLDFYGRNKYEFDSICYELVITGEYARNFLTDIADINDIKYPERYDFNYKDDDYMYVRLSDINIRKYKGKRYNFEVEDDHTYLVPVIAHNCFGTVLNRFIVQALIGEDLTVYGKGEQQRGFLALNDSIQCLMLAIENPPERGEYRTWNQLDTPYSMIDVANIIIKITKLYGLFPKIKHIESPRAENTNKVYYSAKVEKLKNLGFKPTRNVKDEIEYIMNKITEYNILNEIKTLKSVVMPKIIWRKS